MFAFKAVCAHLLSKGGGDKRAKHAFVESRLTTLFAFKAVGAYLRSLGGGVGEGQKS